MSDAKHNFGKFELIIDGDDVLVCGDDLAVGTTEYDVHYQITPEVGRLLCASPDMLEALEGIISDYHSNVANGETPDRSAIREAESAIAKARGEKS